MSHENEPVVQPLKVVTKSLAATLVLLHLLSTKRNSTFWTTCCCCGLSLHSSLDLTGHGEKSLFDIGGSFGWRLKELNTKAIGKFLALLRRYNSLPGKIGFISDKEFVYILSCISVNFVQPLFYIVERFLISNIVDDDNAMGTSIIGRSDSSETLLTGSVPNL